MKAYGMCLTTCCAFWQHPCQLALHLSGFRYGWLTQSHHIWAPFQQHAGIVS